MFSLINDETEIYILCGYTDFRKGMDSLTQMIVEQGIDIQKDCLVIFMSRRKDRLKMLRWINTGMILITYRLEEGKFSWLKGTDIKNITRKQLEWLLDGLSLVQEKYIKPVDKEITFY
jgi:transposase